MVTALTSCTNAERRHIGEISFDGSQHLGQLFRLSRPVALIPAPAQRGRLRIDDDTFNRRRSDIDADDEVGGCYHGDTALTGFCGCPAERQRCAGRTGQSLTQIKVAQQGGPGGISAGAVPPMRRY
jgi:hypothetical protein